MKTESKSINYVGNRTTLSIEKKNISGIYFLKRKNEVVYVGKTNNFFERIGTHISRGIKTAGYTKDFDNIEFIPINYNENIDYIESIYIHILKPKYNKIPQ